MLDSGFGDFFRQLPPIFIIMFCGSSLALVAVFAVIINNRGKRARAAEASATPITVHTATVGNPPPSGGSGGDLPDLDSLLNVDPSSPAPRPIQRGTFMVNTTLGESIEAVEVMTILRDVAEGGLIIQIGDKVYRNPPALADAEFKRRFNSTVRDLYKSISDTSLSTKATGEVTAAVEEEVQEEPPVAPPPPAPPIVPGAPVPGDLPKFKVPDFQEKPKRGRKGPAEEIPEINIAAAIEEYLQYKLSMTPQFARRFIHVRPAVGGGLRIDVDDKSYETVGEVEDEAVRLFLQATIDEWQSRQ
ncbi:MAG TPA: hypothetical protein VK003_21650 [Oceanobacillus sp.]|nr:hypothetical protein [Oceanobacillus sp.]